jgi:hypothetical protein
LTSASGKSSVPISRLIVGMKYEKVELRSATVIASARNRQYRLGPWSRQATDFQSIRTETHKYVEYNNGEKELCDLTADPYELESLHESADPALLEDLKAKLEALKSCSEDAP